MDAISIIVVDDEPVVCAAYARVLEGQGHKVRRASDAYACRAALKAEPADIVLLDLQLPGIDGLAYAAELRASVDIGVIVITSRAEFSVRVTALDQGADDYLIKPVDPGELAARVRSLARRRNIRRGRVYGFAGWRIYQARRAVTVPAGQDGRLTRGEFDLLSLLLEANGKVVSRDALGEVIGRGGAASDLRSVDALVSRLRRKLIVTVPGFGYRLEGSVKDG